jgi:hypothetical protein
MIYVSTIHQPDTSVINDNSSLRVDSWHSRALMVSVFVDFVSITLSNKIRIVILACFNRQITFINASSGPIDITKGKLLKAFCKRTSHIFPRHLRPHQISENHSAHRSPLIMVVIDSIDPLPRHTVNYKPSKSQLRTFTWYKHFRPASVFLSLL